MQLSVYAMSVETFVPMLRNLSNLLDKGSALASAKGFDPVILVNARLAPDMFGLAQQVRIACDQAMGATARLMGREPLRLEDNEQTLADLKSRISRTIQILEGAQPADFQGAESRDIKMPLRDGLVLEMKGAQYLRDWALPHFYFHVVTAYDILRHNGVDIGKRDYISHAASAIRQTS